MIIETKTKVRLNDEEKETLKKANKIVNDVFDEIHAIESEVDLEDDVLDVLDDLQATIRYLI